MLAIRAHGAHDAPGADRYVLRRPGAQVLGFQGGEGSGDFARERFHLFG